MTKPIKRAVRPASQANPTPQPVASDESLPLAADTLFGSPSNELILRDGFKVEVGYGKTRHIGLLLKFFNTLMTKMDPQQIAELVKLISQRQIVAVEEGKKPSEVSVDDLVTKAFGNGSLLLTLLHSVNDLMPEVVGSLSNVTAERYEDLDIDEGMRVVTAVFMMNYSFFSRNLPLVFRGFLVQLNEKTK